MTLGRMIEFIKSHEKELILFNVQEDDSFATDIAERFETQNVCVSTGETASGTPQMAVLSSDGSVLAAEPLATLRDALESDSGGSNATAPLAGAESTPILSHLKESTFTSYDTQQLLYASREIEDRAHRVGDGTIHAGFQRVSLMAAQQRVYTDLARRGVEVHAYGLPDAEPPDLGSGHVHVTESDELARSWFVVFDGGSDETQKTALLAQESGSDSYFGAWTYDPQLVDTILTYLERRYLSSPAGGQSSQSNDRRSSGA